MIEPIIEGEVERVFSFVHNKNQAKKDAQQAIMESDLFIKQSEAFYAHWFFESKEELSEYIMTYHSI
ncbi:MAG: hypothetical protein GY792_01360 [Gammaproteobacteria bacterium]|nr:hypothetical protein [Gammaproteobacteria bacterium]